MENAGVFFMKLLKGFLHRFAQIDIVVDEDDDEGDDQDWEEKLKKLSEEAESKEEKDAAAAANAVKPFTLD